MKFTHNNKYGKSFIGRKVSHGGELLEEYVCVREREIGGS